MPLIDGPTPTKLICEFEAAFSPPLSKLVSLHGRMPIFAVSASLVEQKHDEYVNGGFDGWIMKPINFRQLNTLMTGIWDEKEKQTCVYKPGCGRVVGGFNNKSGHGVLGERSWETETRWEAMLELLLKTLPLLYMLEYMIPMKNCLQISLEYASSKHGILE